MGEERQDAAQPERWFMLCLAVPLTVTSALRCCRRSLLGSFVEGFNEVMPFSCSAKHDFAIRAGVKD